MAVASGLGWVGVREIRFAGNFTAEFIAEFGLTIHGGGGIVFAFQINGHTANEDRTMPTRNTKKAERAALAKQRRAIRKKLAAHKASKRSGLKLKKKTHPHRRTAALR